MQVICLLSRSTPTTETNVRRQAFQVVSLDGWQQVMWHTQDTAGEETWVFFVVLLVLGNVILVSVSFIQAWRPPRGAPPARRNFYLSTCSLFLSLKSGERRSRSPPIASRSDDLPTLPGPFTNFATHVSERRLVIASHTDMHGCDDTAPL